MRATVEHRAHGRWHRLKGVRTDGSGTFTARTGYRSGRQYRLWWSTYTGPATRVTRR